MASRIGQSIGARMAACLALAAAPAPALAADQVAIMAELSGAQVIGRAADSDGSGRMVATLDPRTRQLCYEIEVRLIGQATVAAIYAGRAGRAATTGIATLSPPDSRGRARGCVALAKNAARQLASDPSAAHVSIHNALYPGGALRGQLAAGGPGLAAVDGETEPDPVRVPSGQEKPPAPGYTGPVFTGT